MKSASSEKAAANVASSVNLLSMAKSLQSASADIGGSGSVGHTAKRLKVDLSAPLERCSPHHQVIWTALKQISNVSCGESSETFEIELRIGMILRRDRRLYPRDCKRVALAFHEEDRRDQSLLFKAGIDETLAQQLKLQFLLQQEKYTADRSHKANQILHCDSFGNRYLEVPPVNKDDPPSYSLEHKEKKKTTDIALISYDYDIRVGLATEKITKKSLLSLPQGITMTRHKKRWSYRLNAKLPAAARIGSIWRIDFTEVHVQLPPEAGESYKEYELEFELDADFTKAWMRTPNSPEKDAIMTNPMVFQLLYILDNTIPSMMEMVNSMTLSKSDDKELLSLAQELNRRAKNTSSDTGRMEFLGSMPINLYRRSFNMVLDDDYFVAEKSDGVRYLLYTMTHPKAGKTLALMMNRTKDLFNFPLNDLLGEMLGPGHILDGEVVYHLELQKSVFLVFDVLCWNFESCMNKAFHERKKLLDTVIIPSYRKTMKESARLGGPANGSAGTGSGTGSASAAGGYMLQLIAKKFFDKLDLGELLLRCIEDRGERVYRDEVEDVRVCHKTDGIIFQPKNTVYVPSRNYDLFKWKWSDLRSVDLGIMLDNPGSQQITEKNVFLWCEGPDRSQVQCTKRGSYNVGLGPYDTRRMLVEAEQEAHLKGLNGRIDLIIVEVAYDIHIGAWRYIQARRDKSEPNYIDTVLGVFTEQAEAISVEELLYSLMSKRRGFDNDFEYQITKFKKKGLMDFASKR